MPEFHETQYGRRFFDGQLPALIKALEQIATMLTHPVMQPTPVVRCTGEVHRESTCGKCGENHSGRKLDAPTEMWVVTWLDTRDPVKDKVTLRSSVRSAKDIVRDRISDDKIPESTRGRWLAELEAWNGEADVTVGPHRIRLLDVED